MSNIIDFCCNKMFIHLNLLQVVFKTLNAKGAKIYNQADLFLSVSQNHMALKEFALHEVFL